MEDIDKMMWAVPVYEYVDEFNARCSDLDIICEPASVMEYVHLHYVLKGQTTAYEDKILYISVTHSDTYNISGHFVLRPLDCLSDEANKERATGIAKAYFGPHFAIFDEEDRNQSSYVSAPQRPAIMHSYFSHAEFHHYTDSELYFPDWTVTEFKSDYVDIELGRFLRCMPVR